MSKIVLFLCGVFFVSGAYCEDATESRSLAQYGVFVTWGADSGLSNPGGGISSMSFTYLDPTTKDGAYFSLLSGGYLSHSAGGVVIADSKLLMLGWRQSLFGSEVSVDTNIAPTVGARIEGDKILGSAYTGIGGAVGIYFPTIPGFDIGLSWEPVINLYNWGNTATRNMSYVDFVLYVVAKRRVETKNLPWEP